MATNKQVVPYVLETITGATTAINFSRSWLARESKNVIGIAFELTVPMVNGDVIGHDADERLFAETGLQFDVRSQTYGYHGNGVDARLVEAMSVATGYNNNTIYSDAIGLHTIAAGATEDIRRMFFFPFSDRFQNDGLDGCIASKTVKDYAMRCADIMAGQHASLTLAPAGWSVRIIAMEVDGVEIFGQPLCYKTGVVTDTMEKIFEAEVTHLAVFNGPANLAAMYASEFTIRRDGKPLIENTEAILAHSTAQVPRDADYQMPANRCLSFIWQGDAWCRSDIKPSSLLSIEKRDSAYPALSMLGYAYLPESSKESIRGAAATANRTDDDGDAKVLAARTKGGSLKLVTQIDPAWRKKVPLTSVSSAKAKLLLESAKL